MINLNRRSFITLAAMAVAQRGWAGEIAPSAVSLAQANASKTDATLLQITNGDGVKTSLADYAGQLVVLNLWGPWCLPCVREMPSLARLETLVDPAKIAVLPLAFEPRGMVWVKRFYQQHEISNLPALLGDGKDLKAVLGLEYLPATAILDKSSRHIFTVSGEAQWDDLATIEWLKGLAG